MTGVELRIDAQWNKQDAKMNWPEMELVQRAILLEYKNRRFTAEQAIYWLDECLAAYTRRGNVLPKGMLRP